MNKVSVAGAIVDNAFGAVATKPRVQVYFTIYQFRICVIDKYTTSVATNLRAQVKRILNGSFFLLFESMQLVLYLLYDHQAYLGKL